MKPKTPESGVLRACLDLLAAEKIWHMRMNVGAVKNGHRFVRFGRPGTADILATPRTAQLFGPVESGLGQPVKVEFVNHLWIETKSDIGKQSSAQKNFQHEVCKAGHQYLLVRKPEDLVLWLKEHGAM